MTKNADIPPMIRKRRIYLLVFDGFELLDLSGPASVFNTADWALEAGGYETVAVSAVGGLVASSTGIAVSTEVMDTVRLTGSDTVLAVGGEAPALERAADDSRNLDWLRAAAAKVERYGSVCSGAFLLADAGLLDGKRAATHWAGCNRLRRRHPKVEVDADAVYVREDRLWTSAGVTTGIDMALAMVEGDWGRALKGEVAKRLIVQAHRPGNQSQFSNQLAAQMAGEGDFSDLIAWLDAHLHEAVKVETMAQRMGLSERSFFRRFTDAMGRTPAKFLEDLRLERAKTLLEDGKPVKSVAGLVGFRSVSGFRAAFEARFAVSPAFYRRLSTPNPAQ